MPSCHSSAVLHCSRYACQYKSRKLPSWLSSAVGMLASAGVRRCPRAQLAVVCLPQYVCLPLLSRKTPPGRVAKLAEQLVGRHNVPVTVGVLASKVYLPRQSMSKKMPPGRVAKLAAQLSLSRSAAGHTRGATHLGRSSHIPL